MNTSLFTWGVILVVIGLIGSLYFLSENKECDTAINGIVEAIGFEADDCETIEALMYAFIVIGIIGLILLTIGAAKSER